MQFIKALNSNRKAYKHSNLVVDYFDFNAVFVYTHTSVIE